MYSEHVTYASIHTESLELSGISIVGVSSGLTQSRNYITLAREIELLTRELMSEAVDIEKMFYTRDVITNNHNAGVNHPHLQQVITTHIADEEAHPMCSAIIALHNSQEHDVIADMLQHVETQINTHFTTGHQLIDELLSVLQSKVTELRVSKSKEGGEK